MANDSIITVDHLSKRYRLGALRSEESYTALRDVIARNVRGIFRRRDSTAAKAEPTDFWALRDVTFEVKRGEVIGVIGRNGAGKSTLLKVLSRITEPTEGRITIRGRVASLLEVGTGFHPELTGRENIFLNGAILGMSRTEIKAKFDEIVAFAEVERFLDTPVKRYSSGMYVRLAFAVAAHLEPEVLVVDEVLAVGDVAFQKKCLGKMQEVSGKQGRTVLFVSHNMGAVNQLCHRCILLDKGSVTFQGKPKDAIKLYSQEADIVTTNVLATAFRGTLNGTLSVVRLSIGTTDGEMLTTVSPSDEIRIEVEFRCRERLSGFRTILSIYVEGTRLFSLHDVEELTAVEPGSFVSSFVIPAFVLRPGEYMVAAGGHGVTNNDWIWGSDLATVSILEEWSARNLNFDGGLVNVRGLGRRITNAGIESI